MTRPGQPTNAILGLLLAMFGLTAACHTPTRHQVLTFLFDGVPAETNALAGAGEAIPTQVAAGPTTAQSASETPVEILRTMHPPYADRQCNSCHESLFSQDLRVPIPQLCFRCHEDFLDGERFVHAPAGAGDCLVCHHPHQSKDRPLLVRSQPALCQECHPSDEMTGLEGHRVSDLASCIACHDPHRGAARFLLRTPGDEEGGDR